MLLVIKGFRFKGLEHYEDSFAVMFHDYPLGVIKRVEGDAWLDLESGKLYDSPLSAASVMKTRFYRKMSKVKRAG